MSIFRPLPALAGALLIPALLSSPVLADEANSYDCRAPQNVIEVIFNPCGPGDVTYAQEQEEILKRIENNTATSFDYVNYRFLIERNSPGDDGEE